MTKRFSNTSLTASSQNSSTSTESPCPDNPLFTILNEEASYFTSFTTFHGMVRIYNSKTWISLIFWIFVVTTCVILFFYYSGYIIYRFAQKPTFQILNYASYSANETLLPFLLVCPFKNSQQISKYDSGLPFKSVLFDLKRLNNKFDVHSVLSTSDKLHHLRNSTVKDCSKIIRNMMYGRHTINACNYVDLIFYEQTLCMRFDLGKAVPKTLSSQVLKTLFTNTNNESYKIYLQPRNRSVYESSFVTILKPNHCFSARSTLRKKNFMHKKNGGMCVSSWGDVPFVRQKLLLSPKLVYSTKLCEHLRFAVATLKRDNCVLQHLKSLFGAKEQTCNHNVVNITEYRSIATEYTCPPQCEYNEHKLSSISDRLLTTFKKRTNNESSVLEISFTKLYFRTAYQIRQLKALDILCKLGGNLSLFFGFSMITLMETFMFLLKVMLRLIAYKAQKIVMEEEKIRTPSTITIRSEEKAQTPLLPHIDFLSSNTIRLRSATVGHGSQVTQMRHYDFNDPDASMEETALGHRPSLNQLRNRRLLFRRRLNERRQSRSNFRHKDSVTSMLTDPGVMDLPLSKRASIISIGQASLLSVSSAPRNFATLEAIQRRKSICPYNSGVGGF